MGGVAATNAAKGCALWSRRASGLPHHKDRDGEERLHDTQMENLDGNCGMSGKSTVQRRRGLLAPHEGLGDSGQCGQTRLLTAIHLLPRSPSPPGPLFSDTAVVQQEGVGVHVPMHACCEKELIY